MTNFESATVSEVVQFFSDVRSATAATVDELRGLAARIRSELVDERGSDDLVDFAEQFLTDFGSFSANLDRLIEEVPAEVLPGHVVLLDQMYERADRRQTFCVRRKNQIHARGISEQVRPLLDQVYAVTREQFIEYEDLSNARGRLETFIGVDLSGRAPITPMWEAMDVKPNLFGVGLNFNHILGWLRDRFRRRRQ